MGELIILNSFRSSLSSQHRASVIAGNGSLKIGDMVRVSFTGRDHPIFSFTNSGSPVVLIEARMRALSPHEFEVTP